MKVKKIMFMLLVSICLGTWVCCKSVDSVVTPINTSIIGSWEGCDGRVVTFSRDESGKIIGHYTKLAGLVRYKFSENEVGFHLSKMAPGVYVGQVKWRNTSGKETWKKETILLENNILKTTSSDDCSKELTKIKQS